jgi:hypothetical protein
MISFKASHAEDVSAFRWTLKLSRLAQAFRMPPGLLTQLPGGYLNLGGDSFFTHFSQFIIQRQRIIGRFVVFSVVGLNANF